MFLVELRFNCFFVFYEQSYGVIARLVLTYSHLRDRVVKHAHNFVPNVWYSTNFEINILFEGQKQMTRQNVH
jgi:hypothetical protein